MINLKRASEVKGSITLPGDPDLFMLVLSVATVTKSSLIITPLINSPLIDKMTASFKDQLEILVKENKFFINPKNENFSPFIKLKYDDTPYKDLILFMLLGAGKTVAFDKISDEQISYWKTTAIEFGCEINITELKGEIENLKGLSLNTKSNFISEPKTVSTNKIHPFLGLALGANRAGNTIIEYHLSSPLRALFKTLGLSFFVKSNLEQKKIDPLARRIMMMKKSKKSESSKQSFTVNFDFSKELLNINKDINNSATEISLPGDTVLSSLLITLKSLIPTGQFLIEGALAETWAQAPLALLKKMSCRLAIQVTGKSSFGEIALVSIPKFKLVGRKLHCNPLFHFQPYMAALTVLANYSEGQSIYRELEALRFDNIDKIETLLSFVRVMGGRHGEMPDGMVLDGSKQKDGFDLFDSISPDINGAAAIAALRCNGESTINEEPILYRWPNFFELLESITVYKK